MHGHRILRRLEFEQRTAARLRRICAISFFVRPLGTVICGVLGDKVGRQKMLVFVIMLISAATAGIGVLPSYAAIGIAVPLLLVALRLAQGFSVGGEAAGAMTFLAEHSPAGKRGPDHQLRADRVVPGAADRHPGRIRDVSVVERQRHPRLRIRQLGVAGSLPHRHPDGPDRLVHPPRDQRYPEFRQAQGVRRTGAQSAAGGVHHARADGVVVVRREEISGAIAASRKRDAAEAEYIERYRRGETPIQVSGLAGISAGQGVHERSIGGRSGITAVDILIS